VCYPICSSRLSLPCSYQCFTVSIIFLWFQSSTPRLVMQAGTGKNKHNKKCPNESQQSLTCGYFLLFFGSYFDIFICARSLEQMLLLHRQYLSEAYLDLYVCFCSYLVQSESTSSQTSSCLFSSVVSRKPCQRQLPLWSFSHDLLCYYVFTWSHPSPD